MHLHLEKKKKRICLQGELSLTLLDRIKRFLAAVLQLPVEYRMFFKPSGNALPPLTSSTSAASEARVCGTLVSDKKPSLLRTSKAKFFFCSFWFILPCILIYWYTFPMHKAVELLLTYWLTTRLSGTLHRYKKQANNPCSKNVSSKLKISEV